MKPRLLFLFPDNWDRAALRAATWLQRDVDVVCAGFDLFRFPGNARLLTFDARGFVRSLARRHRRERFAGVVSTNEQYGALVAATLARELGLPGTQPHAVVVAQHKALAREALAHTLPEANPAFGLLPQRVGAPAPATAPLPLPFPFFVKPVKAAFSVLARRIDDAPALSRHLAFTRWETHLLRRLVQPYADLARLHGVADADPLRMLAEEVMQGAQVNVDGWMEHGRIAFFGIVDATMYPGTHAFARFDYPSRLPPAMQGRAFAVAEAALRAVGFDHGAFNVELFCDPAGGMPRVIEINPRLAAQFGDLYEAVDGTHPYVVLTDLALGRPPRYTRSAGRHAVAASFVHRAFDGAEVVTPGRGERAWLGATHPDATLHTFAKSAAGRAREEKWLGSYRHAIVNLAAASRDELERRHADIVHGLQLGTGARGGGLAGARAAVRRHVAAPW